MSRELREHWTLFAAVLFFAAVPAQLRADIAPHPFVQEMCEDAELIVEGLCTGGDRVAVGKVWKMPAGFTETTLTIEHLSAYEKAIGEYRRFPEQVDADGIVLFLARGGERWYPLHEAKQERGYAAPGVIWFDERHCYGFASSAGTPWSAATLHAKGHVSRRTSRR